MKRPSSTVLLIAAVIVVAGAGFGVVMLLRVLDPLNSAAVREAASDASDGIQLSAVVRPPVGWATPATVSLYKELCQADQTEARRAEVAGLLISAGIEAEGESFYPPEIRSGTPDLRERFAVLVKANLIKESRRIAAKAAFMQETMKQILGDKPKGN